MTLSDFFNRLIGRETLRLVEEEVIPELKEIKKQMATATQALQDLTDVINELVTDVQATATAIKALIEEISTLHGLNPAAVEAVLVTARGALKTLEDSVVNANAALNPPATVSVSVSPTSATVAVGGTQQFSASVANATDTTVAWAVSPPEVGSVDTNGLFTAAAAGSATVTATSTQDTSKSASASVTVQ